MRKRNRRCLAIAFVAVAGGIIAFPVANLLTHHPGETIILLMPPVLTGVLWFGWPSVRRLPLSKYVAYAGMLFVVLNAAMWVAADAARGRILWWEVVLATYFAIAWRLAWAVWVRTAGRMGERYRRLARLQQRRGRRTVTRARSGRRLVAVARLVPLGRCLLTTFVFAPLLAGSLIHRPKIGNAPNVCIEQYPGVEDIRFETRDGLTLSGWFVAQQGSEDTVIICHGLGANKGNFLSYVGVFSSRPYNVLIFDFRGHGDSDGHTSTFGWDESLDVRAAVDWLKENRPAGSRHIFGLGSSMGAMALVRAAAGDQRIEAIILDSSFVSARSFAHHHLGPLPLFGHIFADVGLAFVSLHAGRPMWGLGAAEAIARNSPRPVFLIHGQGDVVTPPKNMKTLFEAAGLPKQMWLGPGEHSNVLTAAFEEYRDRVLAFFDRAKGTAVPTNRRGERGHSLHLGDDDGDIVVLLGETGESAGVPLDLLGELGGRAVAVPSD